MSDIDTLVGLSIEGRRKRLGLSVTDLARRVGLSDHAIRGFENGSRRATARQLFDIAEALDVPVASLFPSSADERASAGPPPDPPDPGFDGARQAVSHYAALSGPHRAAGYALLVAMQLDRDGPSD